MLWESIAGSRWFVSSAFVLMYVPSLFLSCLTPREADSSSSSSSRRLNKIDLFAECVSFLLLSLSLLLSIGSISVARELTKRPPRPSPPSSLPLHSTFLARPVSCAALARSSPSLRPRPRHIRQQEDPRRRPAPQRLLPRLHGPAARARAGQGVHARQVRLAQPSAVARALRPPHVRDRHKPGSRRARRRHGPGPHPTLVRGRPDVTSRARGPLSLSFLPPSLRLSPCLDLVVRSSGGTFVHCAAVTSFETGSEGLERARG